MSGNGTSHFSSKFSGFCFKIGRFPDLDVA